MGQAISIFIMDVTKSSSKQNWNEVTKHLQFWKKTIENWCGNTLVAKVSHRRGDEILFVAQYYFTAYTIAFKISQHWGIPQQQPYFGISYGSIDENIEILDIEIWNHPLIKKARDQSEKIKKSKNRKISMLFADFAESKALINTSDILNLLVTHQQALLNNQSEQQRLIYSLYSIFNEQKQVAKILNRTQSTISTLYKRGQSELLEQNFNKIQLILGQKEVDDLQNPKNIKLAVNELNTSIKDQLKNHINYFYPNLAFDN